MKKNKPKYTLLYVEDEILIREMFMTYLNDYFISIYVASNGDEAFELYLDKKPDIIITDIKMPKMNGLALASLIRKNDSTTPIIITTAHTTTEYFLHAVELKLIKYLVKPLEEEKLNEALELCFQQIEGETSSICNLTSEYSYDTLNHNLLLNQKKIIPLTSSQCKLLDLLIQHKDRIVSYDELEYYIWPNKAASNSGLRSLVYDLRKVIDKDLIQNISKTGYKIQLHE